MTTDIKEPSGDIMEIPSLIRRILHSSAYGCLRTDDRTALAEYILDVLRMRSNGLKSLARAEKAEAEVERLKVEHDRHLADAIDAQAVVKRLTAERDRLKELYDAGCKQWNPVFKVVLDERDRLAGEVVTLKASLNEWVRENAPGGWIDTFRNQARERDRLKAALEKFIAEANTAPKRIIGNGIGGQTMEATLKASGRLISEWQIERLRNSMELHVEGCREEL